MRILGLTIPGAISGADAAIFDGLRDRGLLADVVPCEVPLPTQLSLLAQTFKPRKRAWGSAWRTALYKTPHAFNARSAANDRVLRRRTTEFDIVLQVSGLFAPFVGSFPKPVAIFCDYTTKLAERNYSDWFGLRPHEVPAWYALERQLYHDAEVVLTGSENTRRSVIADYGVPAECVRVVGEGVRSVPEASPKRYDHPVVLFVGIDFARKGGACLLEAFERVRARVPSAELHIVGPYPQTPRDGITWHGHLADRERIDALFAAATVLTLPSLCEPFGLALIEGMAHRLPVVGTLIDAMSEIVDDGVTGYLVPPNDPQALADKLVYLLDSPSLCEQFGARGQQIVREKFMWSQVVDRVVNGLSAALRRRESSQIS